MPATRHSVESQSTNRWRQHLISSSSSTVLRQHELELWGLTTDTDELSIYQYGPDNRETLESILVPIAGGPNSHAAVQVAADLARTWTVPIKLVTIVPPSSDRKTRMEADARLQNHADELTVPVTTAVLLQADVVGTITERSHNHDLIVIGQTNQSLLNRLFKGAVPSKLQNQTDIPIFVVEQDSL